MTNQITIRGGLGRDAELRFTSNGRPVLNLSVGDGKSRKDDSGNWQELRDTIWHRVAIWGAVGQMWADSGLMVKGAQVEVTGELEIREYEHNGEQRWSSEINAYQVGVKEPRGDQQQRAPQRSQQYAPPPEQDPWGSQVAGTQTQWPEPVQPADPSSPPF